MARYCSAVVSRHIPAPTWAQPAPHVVQTWVEAFVGHLATALALQRRPAAWTAEQLADTQRRRERYAGDEWTRRR